MTPLEELRARIDRACMPEDRPQIPRLHLLRVAEPQPLSAAFYSPVVCFAAQGRKRLVIADRECGYDAAHYLVVAVDMPVMAQVAEASEQAPYLSARLDLDPAMLASLLLDVAGSGGPRTAGLGIGPLDAPLLDAVLRLVRLLDEPEQAAAIAPLVEREILYRLLAGPQGPMLRQIALADSRLSQVARAIAHIRAHYDRSLRIADLARIAAMSPATFNRHFRAVTAMSPLQFQKRLRLHEARRRLLTGDRAVQAVGFDLGYDSPSQFSREYARLFGAPPARDAARLRDAGPAGAAA